MRLARLELDDWRSYDRAAVDFGEGVTILVGPNAQGKTNLLEAIVRLATGGSHRVSSDVPLVRADRELAVIRSVLTTDEGRRRTLNLEVASGRRTRTVLDGQDVRRAADAIGVLRIVLFAPEDLAIVRDDPSARRRFLDDVLAMRRPAYANARSEYDRVLRQRNHLLRGARGLRGDAAANALVTLDTWTDQLVTHGAAILAARVAGTHALAAPVDTFYRDLADRPEPITLTYASSAGFDVLGVTGTDVPAVAPYEEAMRTRLAERADEERARGITLVGPHRDDLELAIGGLAARGYSSHGEAWSLALSLKLATHGILDEVGDRPVVLLDDVFAELDTTRRGRLAAACANFDQVIVTAAVEEDVPLEGAKIDVALVDRLTRITPRTT